MAKRKKGGPGKSYREGISLFTLHEMFPDEQSAVDWFESIYWPEVRCCGHCGSVNTRDVKNRKPQPYWCMDCKSYFSIRTGTTLQNSRLPLRKWVFATYLYVTSLKGISSMRLHRDLGVTQKTAWYMLHRLRQAWDESGIEQLMGPVEVDETYIGGKRNNMSKSKRYEISQREKRGRGATDKTPVVGIKDRATNQIRAKVVRNTGKQQLHGFIG